MTRRLILAKKAAKQQFHPVPSLCQFLTDSNLSFFCVETYFWVTEAGHVSTCRVSGHGQHHGLSCSPKWADCGDRFGVRSSVRDEFIAVLRRALRRVPCFLKDGQSFARFLFPNPTAVLLFFISQSFEETSPLKSRLFSQALPEVISGRLNCIGFACPACKVPVILLPILSLPGEFALLA